MHKLSVVASIWGRGGQEVVQSSCSAVKRQLHASISGVVRWIDVHDEMLELDTEV